ncbi:uncharacterized protein LOC117679866 [Pantherophis guttatus]|uniref:ribonuclease H n=1 Tax=Pantherophis guttatus TaxID=94885 RepID=A0A6P9E406_PANGU|nr:uncharacterized protein LOC117679866 [Pantherophis guttatus]
MSKQCIKVQGVAGTIQSQSLTQPIQCQIGKVVTQHQFIYMPDCPIPLLGRDLLQKLQAQITFLADSNYFTLTHLNTETWRLLHVSEPNSSNSWKAFNVSSLWAEDNPPGFAKYATPIQVDLCPGAYPVNIPQRQYSLEAVRGIHEFIRLYLKEGILRRCRSHWNTAILPVRKPNGNWRPVQDLRPLNRQVLTVHAIVSNPYTLFSNIPATSQWFSVIDLKDAFFTIPLAEKSQFLFAFEWTDPDRYTKTQYTWTRLPQGFKNSPTHFSQALANDLHHLILPVPDGIFLQYIDDILITGDTKDSCWQNTNALLHRLQDCGYRASREKAQLVQNKVNYLGFILTHGKRLLGTARIQAIQQIPIPINKHELQGFLGSSGYCRMWIPNFAMIATPLYEATKGKDTDSFNWTTECKNPFETLKSLLSTSPALGLPDLTKPFHLYVEVRRNVALGVFTQRKGKWQRPVAYLSKQLDPASKGWPHCLKIIAAIVLLLVEAQKLTFASKIQVYTSHAISAILENKGHLWLSNQRLHKYQALLLDSPDLTFHQCATLNPATLLPSPDTSLPLHDCLMTIDASYSCRPDLSDQPLSKSDYTWFTDGSSFMEGGIHYTGFAVVSLKDTICSGALPSSWSAQAAELWTLIKAMIKAKGKSVNLYTDSKYAFLTVQAHAAIYRERGFVDSLGKPIQHLILVKALLKAAQLPSKLALIHCPGHKRDLSDISKGNRKADAAARFAARQGEPYSNELFGKLYFLDDFIQQHTPSYTKTETEQFQTDLDATFRNGWYYLPNQQPVILASLAKPLVMQAHSSHHCGKSSLAQLLNCAFYIPLLPTLVASVTATCATCAQVNPRQGKKPPPGVQPVTFIPMDYLILDFIDMPKCQGYSALLMIIDSYTGWLESYPCLNKTALTVAKCLLKDIIRRFGCPSQLSSDNRPEFVHKINQQLADTIGTRWRYHCSFHSQSS